VSIVEAKQGRIFIGKLPYGSDLLSAVKEVAEKNNVKSAVFFIIGSVKRAHLAYYHQVAKRYLDYYVEKPTEIVSCIGNIAELEGQTFPHTHIVLSDSEGNTYGGHVLDGTIVFAAEIYMVELKEVVLRRAYDEVTGLKLFQL